MTQELTAADDGRHLRVAPGEMVVLALPEVPTTGYRWEVVDLDASVASLSRVSYEGSPGAAVGGGGRRIFVFTAGSTGTASVRLSCQRSWGTQPPDRTFAVSVEVVSGGAES